MNASETFITNLLRVMQERGLKPATLSKMAGLNARAVKDMEEGRVRSPKLSTVFALAEALDLDPGEMMGLGPRPKIQRELAGYLSQYSAEEQEQLLSALNNFPLRQPSEQ